MLFLNDPSTIRISVIRYNYNRDFVLVASKHFCTSGSSWHLEEFVENTFVVLLNLSFYLGPVTIEAMAEILRR